MSRSSVLSLFANDLTTSGLSYPNSDGTAGQFLKTNGNGLLSFDSVAAGGGGGGLDSALATQLIDSAYVQARQDFAYGSLTGAPTYLDSTTVTGVINATYIQSNQTTYLDSALVTSLIDSDYVSARSGGGGGGLAAWQEKTANYTLVAGDRIVIDTLDSARTLTLPASPSFSDEVSIIDGRGNAFTNNITIARNGKKILAADSDLIINVNRATVSLMYYNDSQGWILTSAL